MKSFKQLMHEAVVDGFMSKIQSAQTKEGVDELEKYYTARKKEVELKASDDISIRDAISGSRQELKSMEQEKEPEDF